ncbi:uncharacterized protein B0I36DRAFT_355925 [Microdochium trichocladiopsis]|uniref:BTB domain-containing protein n=1 Tax=Microdochium trichocladiopsis TaxID=1682393 RepID=A0A9P8XU28_9PEZI|nr:uncharacterized protein B0I36DRAFT_355925 [Microdochium trichocladiopsis]KAH7012529.1 hypothetical protein B0I36DRAFT_355925 [Microdochium trichocladiopsis]
MALFVHRETSYYSLVLKKRRSEYNLTAFEAPPRSSTPCLAHIGKKVELDLSSDNPKTVELPEDNFQAMLFICRVIHHRNELVPRAIDPADLLHVATAIDKYGMSVALKFALAQWLHVEDSMDMTSMGYIMAASYRLADEEVFVKLRMSHILRAWTKDITTGPGREALVQAAVTVDSVMVVAKLQLRGGHVSIMGKSGASFED